VKRFSRAAKESFAKFQKELLHFADNGLGANLHMKYDGIKLTGNNQYG
jgi:hypothetical protein